MKKKGFTLIELLAVILILAIIAAIISPIIGNIIENAREQSAKRSAERYIRAAQKFYVDAELDANKKELLGTNIINRLDLENDRATGVVVAYPDGTTEMAVVINNICFTKSTTQDVVDIQMSKETENCTIVSSNVTISSVASGDDDVTITVNDNGTGVTMTSCKFSPNPGVYDTDGTISGNTCVLAPTTSGTRYYYELIFSDGSKRYGSVQANPGEVITPNNGGTGTGGGGYNGESGTGGNNGGNNSGGNGGSSSGGNQFGGIAGPVEEAANGRTIYTGRMLSQVKTIFFNVTTGTKCDIVDFTGNGGNNTNGMNSGCLKFYAYMEDDVAYTAILDRNLNDGRYAWASSGNNGSGPVTALSTLKSLTDSWQGTVTPKNYINVYMSGGEAAYRIPYETDGYKARFITTDEIARITGNTAFSSVTTGTGGWYYLDGGTSASTGQTWQTQIATSSESSAYKWLFNYLRDCSSYGCSVPGISYIFGYWTSDAIASTTNYVWAVTYRGAVSYNGEHSGYTATADRPDAMGIRPVVTILKSALQ